MAQLYSLTPTAYWNFGQRQLSKNVSRGSRPFGDGRASRKETQRSK